MSSIIKQLTEWQYHAYILIIVIGLIGFMHVQGVHYIHSSIWAFVGLVVALEVLDVISHTIMGLLGWED